MLNWAPKGVPDIFVLAWDFETGKNQWEKYVEDEAASFTEYCSHSKSALAACLPAIFPEQWSRQALMITPKTWRWRLSVKGLQIAALIANFSGEETELSQKKHYVSSSNFSQFIYNERATTVLTSSIFFP